MLKIQKIPIAMSGFFAYFGKVYSVPWCIKQNFSKIFTIIRKNSAKIKENKSAYLLFVFKVYIIQ